MIYWLKLAPYIGALVLLAGFGVWAHHHGYAAAEARCVAQSVARDQAEASALAAAQVTQAAEAAVHKAKDIEVVNELQTQLAGARATADDLASKLRAYANQGRRSAVPSAGPSASAFDGARDRQWCDSRIESRTSAVLEAAEACAAELGAWQKRGR